MSSIGISVIVFMMGLISEQIALLRMERRSSLFSERIEEDD